MNERKIVDYIVVWENTINELRDEIVKYNKEGYELHGSPFFDFLEGKFICVRQAMVKYEESEK